MSCLSISTKPGFGNRHLDMKITDLTRVSYSMLEYLKLQPHTNKYAIKLRIISIKGRFPWQHKTVIGFYICSHVHCYSVITTKWLVQVTTCISTSNVIAQLSCWQILFHLKFNFWEKHTYEKDCKLGVTTVTTTHAFRRI